MVGRVVLVGVSVIGKGVNVVNGLGVPDGITIACVPWLLQAVNMMKTQKSQQNTSVFLTMFPELKVAS